MRKRAKRRARKIIPLFFFLLFSILFIYSGYKIIEWLIDNKQSGKILEEIANTVTIIEETEEEPKYEIDFKSLKEKNEDIVAWIKINGTNIEYPIVKTKNNDFYMNHSFDKSYNGAGWIFADCKNNFDGKDKNIVIYGHNRRDGSMFGSLKNILKEEWYNNKDNYIFPLISLSEKNEYQVFSIYTTKVEDYYIRTEFSDDESFLGFVNNIKSRSIKYFDVSVNKEDNILTLSTCADNNQYRVVLHAKKI